MGQVITFYSYKGGVGRSMALANIAILLSKWNYRVLVVDWDLEAPGLEYFFSDYINLRKVHQKTGIIDLLQNITENIKAKPHSWEQMLLEINVDNSSTPINFISAGKKDSNYYQRVRELDFKNIYLNNGGYILEKTREEWKSKYDFILIDSRTGITDIGGVCTIHMPDILVLLFTATKQSIDGTAEVAKKAHENRKDLPVDRFTLLSLPILSRFDSTEEFKVSQSWLKKSSIALKDVYLNWLPRKIEIKNFLEITKIPYTPYFSFGEKLPVVEQGTVDPVSIGYSYETISATLANNLENVDILLENRNTFIDTARNKTQSKKQYLPKIFIIYAREDSAKAKELHERLLRSGYQPWLDAFNLKPGSNWKQEIKREIKQSDFVIVCMSSSLNKEKGYVRIELNYALGLCDGNRKDSNTLIPVRFDENVSDLPQSLSAFQWVNLYEDDGYGRLKKTIDNFIKEIELSRVIIITSHSSQYTSLRSSISDIGEISLPSGILCEKGIFAKGKSRWEVILCEIGSYSNYPSKILSELMRFFTPRVVIRLGFAAGLRGVDLGDLVISTNSLKYHHTEKNNLIDNLPLVETSTVSIEQRARLEAKKENWLINFNDSVNISNRRPNIFFGLSLVSPKIISEPLNNFSDHYPNIMAIEMEGSSVAEALEEIPQKFELLTLLGVTDSADARKNDNYLNITSKNMDSFIFEVLSNY